MTIEDDIAFLERVPILRRLGAGALRILAIGAESYTVEEGQVTVFVAVDHCTTECVGLHAAKKATRFEALEPLRQGVREYCGGFRAGAAHDEAQVNHEHRDRERGEAHQQRPCIRRARRNAGVAVRACGRR